MGNAWLGNASRGLVWQNRITGEVQIWRTTPNPEKLSFFILPTWIISGLGDVNGDGITDFIWTNPLFNASYFWIMNDLTTFPTAVAEVTTRGQWISNPPLWPPLPLGAQPATFSLVAVDDFRFPQVGQDGFPVTGPEQSAADLVWRQLSQGSQNDVLQSPGISLWQMGYQFLDCADIGIDLVLGGCEKETGVYELVRNPEILPPQDAFWEVAGSGDFDRDGRADLIWYAGGSGAGDLAGKFQLWRFLEDGSVSRELLHDSTGSDTIVQPGAMMFAGGVQ